MVSLVLRRRISAPSGFICGTMRISSRFVHVELRVDASFARRSVRASFPAGSSPCCCANIRTLSLFASEPNGGAEEIITAETDLPNRVVATFSTRKPGVFEISVRNAWRESYDVTWANPARSTGAMIRVCPLVKKLHVVSARKSRRA
jgi:hypothetical protein